MFSFVARTAGLGAGQGSESERVEGLLGSRPGRLLRAVVALESDDGHGGSRRRRVFRRGNSASVDETSQLGKFANV